MLTDPIADMLTRIRNGLMSKHDVVEMPHSKMKARIGAILLEEGFIHDLAVEGETKKVLRLKMKYHNRRPVIEWLERVSSPGRRIYVGAEDLPPIKSGLGIAILSTSRGVLVDRQARQLGIGGELLCRIW